MPQKAKELHEYKWKPYGRGYMQEDINAALHAVRNLGWSARRATKIHQVPHNTLTDRLQNIYLIKIVKK